MTRETAIEDSDTRRGGYAAAIVMDAVMLYVVHHVLEWDVPFITPAFGDVVWAFNLSLGTSIVVNALLMTGDLGWWRRLGDVARDVTALLSTYMLYQVFPFDLPSGMATLLAMALVVIMVLLVISTIVHSVQAVAGGLHDLATA